MKKIKVLVVDDHILFGQSLTFLLQTSASFDTVTHKNSGELALNYLLDNPVDLVLSDVRMPGMDGIELTKRLSRLYPKIGVIAITGSDVEQAVESMFEAGAKGFIYKNTDSNELIQTILDVSAGKMVYPNCFVSAHKQPEKLSKREVEIIALVASGLTSKEIAQKLFISPLTVKTHRAKIMKKLELCSKAALIRYSLEHKILA